MTISSLRHTSKIMSFSNKIKTTKLAVENIFTWMTEVTFIKRKGLLILTIL